LSGRAPGARDPRIGAPTGRVSSGTGSWVGAEWPCSPWYTFQGPTMWLRGWPARLRRLRDRGGGFADHWGFSRRLPPTADGRSSTSRKFRVICFFYRVRGHKTRCRFGGICWPFAGADPEGWARGITGTGSTCAPGTALARRISRTPPGAPSSGATSRCGGGVLAASSHDHQTLRRAPRPGRDAWPEECLHWASSATTDNKASAKKRLARRRI